MIEEFAPAKVNLSLRVVGKRADGYHLLDSVVAFADVGDRLRFEPAAETSLEISGAFAKGLPADDSNLVLRAARALAAAFPARAAAVRITLEKNLPLASGLGGGSADAAATLRGLARLWGIATDLGVIALSLGADVPVCLSSRPARMRGIGEELQFLSGFQPLHAVLVNPGIAVATRDVFSHLRHTPADPAQWTNDLETPALKIAPEIGAVLAALRATGEPREARMSGSGSTCFALYADAARAASAARNLAGRSGWWVKAVTLGGQV